jgi:hypothetical protein
MSTKSRQVIYSSRIRGAKIRAEGAREEATKAIRAADRAQAEAWSIQMEGFGGPAQPSPSIAQCLNGGYGWLEVECHRCKTRASIPLDAIRRPRNTPIWKLEAALKCRSCRTPRYSPPVHMIRLTREREIVPYVWMHPDGSAKRLARRAYVRGRATHQQAPCLATDYFRIQSPTGDDGHFGPSAAPPLGQKTDTSASLDSQLTGESPWTTRMAPLLARP